MWAANWIVLGLQRSVFTPWRLEEKGQLVVRLVDGLWLFPDLILLTVSWLQRYSLTVTFDLYVQFLSHFELSAGECPSWMWLHPVFRPFVMGATVTVLGPCFFVTLRWIKLFTHTDTDFILTLCQCELVVGKVSTYFIQFLSCIPCWDNYVEDICWLWF